MITVNTGDFAGSDTGIACAEAVFILNQVKVSVTLTSTGLQLTKLNSGFPGFGRRHIPASGKLLSKLPVYYCFMFSYDWTVLTHPWW